MAGRVVLVAGATGLVGRELVRLLVQSTDFSRVHSLVRRSIASIENTKVTEHVVDFEALPALPSCDDALIALGTTRKAAGSQAAFRRVDYDYVLAVAEAARAAGALRLGLVSAIGADVSSRVFYNRVKGEVEAAVSRLGYESVIIARPSLLVGDREGLGQPARRGEHWAERWLGPVAGLIPSSFRPVSAVDVAASLLRRLRTPPPGVSIVLSRDMHGAAVRR
jgi:uncharacterized protein YbjT (DUF2867 family)